MKSLPWALDGKLPGIELTKSIDVNPTRPDVEAWDTKVLERPQEQRRYYITKIDLTKFGYTAGCKACDHTQDGKRKPCVNHSDHCRDRIEAAVAQNSERGPRLATTALRYHERLDGTDQNDEHLDGKAKEFELYRRNSAER